MTVIGHGICWNNFSDIMARLAKMQDRDDRPVCHHPILRPVKSVMAKRSTYVDVTYYREFLTYSISTTSLIEVSYKLLVSYELLRSHYVRSRTQVGSPTRPIISWLRTQISPTIMAASKEVSVYYGIAQSLREHTESHHSFERCQKHNLLTSFLLPKSQINYILAKRLGQL